MGRDCPAVLTSRQGRPLGYGGRTVAVTPPPSGPSQAAGVSAGALLGGRYRLDELLASGGMAQVWLGTDEVLRRPIAVKILHQHLAADETFVTRFRHEAIAVARLSHPSIVNVYDTCSDDGVEAIVMELVRGQTLRTTARRRARSTRGWPPTSPPRWRGALAVAHAAGLVHRDIKPANILLSEDGRVKVGDFGIAKAAESADLTQEGSFLGTAKYLAPEQVEAKPVDGRTDLYSLGVVLYEMLCGRVPFEADTSSATALARLHSDPPAAPARQGRACPVSSRPSPCGCWPATPPAATPPPPTCGPRCSAPGADDRAAAVDDRRPTPSRRRSPHRRSARAACHGPVPPGGDAADATCRFGSGQRAPVAGPDAAGRARRGGARASPAC